MAPSGSSDPVDPPDSFDPFDPFGVRLFAPMIDPSRLCPFELVHLDPAQLGHGLSPLGRKPLQLL